jgi:hypothetical protein
VGGAAAESLIDRIGAEMDKRVEARLQAGSSGGSPLAKIPPPGSRALWAGVRIGAGITGAVALVAASVSQSNSVITAVLVVWAILAATTWAQPWYACTARGSAADRAVRRPTPQAYGAR